MKIWLLVFALALTNCGSASTPNTVATPGPCNAMQKLIESPPPHCDPLMDASGVIHPDCSTVHDDPELDSISWNDHHAYPRHIAVVTEFNSVQCVDGDNRVWCHAKVTKVECANLFRYVLKNPLQFN